MSDNTPARAEPVRPLGLIEDVIGRDDIRVLFGPRPRTGHPVIRLIDRATGRLCLRIPPQASRDLAKIAPGRQATPPR